MNSTNQDKTQTDGFKLSNFKPQGTPKPFQINRNDLNSMSVSSIQKNPLKSSPVKTIKLKSQNLSNRHRIYNYDSQNNQQPQLLKSFFSITDQIVGQKVKEVEIEFGKKFKRMYRFPASVNEALVHQRAFKNGYSSSGTLAIGQGQPIVQPTRICPCCDKFVNTIEIPLNYSTYPKAQTKGAQDEDNVYVNEGMGPKGDTTFLLQSGDALFFCFIKLVISFLLLRFLILDVYKLWANYHGSVCALGRLDWMDKICTNWLVSVLSTYNNMVADSEILFERIDLLSLIVTVVTIIFFIYGRIKLRQLYWLLQRSDVTEDDFSILIEDIPPIPFMGNDTLIKDVNQEYKQFIKKIVKSKIRNWINRFYSYSPESDFSSPLDRQFYQVFHQKKWHGNEYSLFDNMVAEVNLCYDLTELENLQGIRQDMINNLHEEQGNQLAIQNSMFDDQLSGNPELSQNRQYIAHIPHQVDIINEHYVKLCERISDNTNLSPFGEKKELVRQKKKSIEQFKISRFVGKAFVSLQYQHFRQYLLNQFQNDRDFFKVNGNNGRLKVSGAQKPNDIYWKNMKVSDQYRKKQIRNSYLLVVVILLLSSSMVYLLRMQQSQIINNNKKRSFWIQMFLYSIPLWTFLVNQVLDWSIFQLTVTEKHKTKTEELSSLIIKNIAAKFFNTSVIYAILFIFGTYVHPLLQNGLVNTLFSLVLVNALLTMGLSMVNPTYQWKQYKNRKYQSKLKANVFQIKLNNSLEYPIFDYAQAYSYYLQMIFICGFYGFIVPITTPIVIIAFAFQFWIDKYNLFRRSSSPVDMGFILTELIWGSFEMVLLLFVLGNIIWGSYFHVKNSTLSIIYNYSSLGLTVVYYMFVFIWPKKLENFTKFFLREQKLCTETYEMAYQKFQQTYRGENPATSFLNQEEEAGTRLTIPIRVFENGQLIHTKTHKIKKSEYFVRPDDQLLEQIYNYPPELTVKQSEQGDAFATDFKTLFFYC